MLIHKKSVTPGQRHLILINKKNLSKKEKLLKHLSRGLVKTGGRNRDGKITVRHQGGGHKRIYRVLDFKYQSKTRIVKSIEYDPNRSGYIGKVFDKIENKFFYNLLAENVNVGTQLEVAQTYKDDIPVVPGNVVFLGKVPIGFNIHNLELFPGQGAKLVRSAGTFAQILQKRENYTLVKLPSGEKRLFSNFCKCTIGVVSNSLWKNRKLGKAGRNRWLNKRPTVRGVAMNPIDHPHGGGEGKTSGGRPSVTPWGVPTKGKPTRSKRRKNILIVERRNKK